MIWFDGTELVSNYLSINNENVSGTKVNSSRTRLGSVSETSDAEGFINGPEACPCGTHILVVPIFWTIAAFSQM